ncbi:MAG TPA: 4Fe-4S binding protein [Bacteroidales bacterium]|nr:4Fe-4S binding protein [Bacteroidales bacterium]
MPITVNKAKCPQNHRCPLLMVCPAQAISQEGSGLPVINESKCTHCGKCTRFCGMGAVEMK